LQEKLMGMAVELIDHAPLYQSKQEMINDVENMLEPIFSLTAQIVTEVSSTFAKKKESKMPTTPTSKVSRKKT